MLLVFHSKAAADVLMLSHHAAPILQAAGKCGTRDQDVPVRGVFTAAQLPAAIAAIEQVTVQEAAPVERVEESDPDTPVPAMDAPVSLRVRAYPLLDMLRRAQKKGVNVVWEAA